MAAMRNLQERNLIDCIRNATQPMLGICLGMQLMTEFSTEGNVAMLGLMSGQTDLIPDSGLPLPHMGWNKVRYTPDHPLFAGIEQDSHFYFVHSYAVQPNENTIATAVTGWISPPPSRTKISTVYSFIRNARVKTARCC